MTPKPAKPTLNILMAEDNPGDVRIVEEALRSSGAQFKLEAVRDGNELLQRLGQADGKKTHLPDILLLDLNMPRMGGLEVLKVLKETPALKSIPIIVLSSSTSVQDVLTAYDSHANCYIAKPLGLDDYFSVVQRIHEFWHNTAELPSGANA